MNILIVSDTYRLIDGVSYHVEDEEQYFRASGHHVTIVSTQTKYTTGYYVKRFKPYYRSFNAHPRKLIKELKKDSPFDVLYSQCLQPQGLYFSLLLAGYFKIPYISRFHSYVPDYFEYTYPSGATRSVKFFIRSLLTLYLQLIYKNTDKVILSVPNKKLYDFITKKLHISPRKITISRIPTAIREKRKHFFWEKSQRVGAYLFLSVGRISNEKNFPFLVHLWNHYIAKEFPQARWRLVGSGPLSEEVKQTITYRNRVEFTGNIPHHQVLEEMKKADVLLHSSLSETFGLVIAEAKSCGLPVIALDDNAGVRAQFDSGKIGGFLVNNESEFLEKLKKILSDRSLYRTIVEESQKDIQTNYSNKEHERLRRIFEVHKEKKEPLYKIVRMRLLAFIMRITLWSIPRLSGKFYEKVED